ncbi:MAG: GlsB/YeaQ/YmgE family stress response membrane protein [Actinomycetota bacterium]
MKNLRPAIGLIALMVVAQKGKVRIDLGTIVLYALIGLLVGIIARFLVPGRDPMGFIGTLVIGVIGAVLGGWLAGAVFPETEGVDWLASILVAILLVLLVRSFSGGRWRRTY